MPERSTPTSPAGGSSKRSATQQAPTSGQRETRAPTAGTDARLGRAYEQLANASVLSLDVFDTLLWRKVPEPADAFIMLGERLAAERRLGPDLDSHAFALLRQRAERLARERRERTGRGEEVTLAEIWAAMPDQALYGIDKDEAIAREIGLERSLLVPDLDVLDLVRAARERGTSVVGVSDTYFSEIDLRSFLATAPLGSIDIDRVFASSTHRVGKAGGLWRVVLDELGTAPADVLHVGDNHHVDVVVPERLGIRSVYFERRPEGLGRVVEREQLHTVAPLSPHHGDYGLTALRSKVLHRTEGRDQPRELRPFWNFGAAALGPALTGFADWIHERAREAGASKVFCLMREGELLARLANAAATYLNSPIRAEPIWLSRQVCARASIVEGTREELSALFLRLRMPTVGEFCATLGIDTAEVPGFTGREQARLNQPGLPEELLDVLTFEPELRARIVANAAELRTRITRYVERLRPPGEDRILLVDLGWGATIQALLDRLLVEAEAPYRTVGLYLIVSDRAADRMLKGTEVHGFLANAGHPSRPVEAFMRSPELLEQICMPDHGSQRGLTEQLEPVLDEVPDTPMQAAERVAAQSGILAFQREWARYRTAAPDSLVPFHEGGQDRLRSILLRSLTSPTAAEAALFGRWLHDENFGSAGVNTLVPLTSARAVRYLEPRSLVETPMAELYWPHGLAALHDEHLAKAVEAATTGIVPWDAFSSRVETGDVEIYVDRGWGFRSDGMAVAEARRNRLGLSYTRGSVAGDIVRRVRIDLAKVPCVLRIDWIRLRCHRSWTTDPAVIDFDDPKRLRTLQLRAMRSIGPSAFVVEGVDPNIVCDIQRLVEGDVHTVDVECAFAVLPLPASGLQRRVGRVKERIRERAKRGRLGSPIRAGFTLLRRID